MYRVSITALTSFELLRGSSSGRVVVGTRSPHAAKLAPTVALSSLALLLEPFAVDASTTGTSRPRGRGKHEQAGPGGDGVLFVVAERKLERGHRDRANDVFVPRATRPAAWERTNLECKARKTRRARRRCRRARRRKRKKRRQEEMERQQMLSLVCPDGATACASDADCGAMCDRGPNVEQQCVSNDNCPPNDGPGSKRGICQNPLEGACQPGPLALPPPLPPTLALTSSPTAGPSSSPPDWPTNTYASTKSQTDDVGLCPAAVTLPSANVHALPVEGSELSRTAFGSCIRPGNQISPALWNHARSTFGAELWVWLGDNQYSDGTSMETKRVAYNAVRDDPYYSQYGPLAEPKIPVTGTWDDHDFAANNEGNGYQCRSSSQEEFTIHFNLPLTDPRHPNQGSAQRRGIYTSHMFAKPGTISDGIHVIILDARYHRSPTFSSHGPCEGAASSMLGDEQWSWLEAELQRTSEVKVIGSGIQVLQPTNRGRSSDSYCAYDGAGGSFDWAIADLGESGPAWEGTTYESWGEMPQERTKLLRLCQKSINDGRARRIVFISGDQHWAEVMAKEMPDSVGVGPSQVLYEVTASGIDQNWPEGVDNSNRVRVRTADTEGDGVYNKECKFPASYGGITYNDCITAGNRGVPWCYTSTTLFGINRPWGNCLPEQDEVVPRTNQTYSKTNICTENYHHTCSAQANYGGIDVDWDQSVINLWVFTPHESEAVASSIKVGL